MVASLQAPLIRADDVLARMRERGYAVLGATAVARLCGVGLDALAALVPTWDDLQPDLYLNDGGNYR
jgi:hypothetical protein